MAHGTPDTDIKKPGSYTVYEGDPGASEQDLAYITSKKQKILLQLAVEVMPAIIKSIGVRVYTKDGKPKHEVRIRLVDGTTKRSVKDLVKHLDGRGVSNSGHVIDLFTDSEAEGGAPSSKKRRVAATDAPGPSSATASSSRQAAGATAWAAASAAAAGRAQAAPAAGGVSDTEAQKAKYVLQQQQQALDRRHAELNAREVSMNQRQAQLDSYKQQLDSYKQQLDNQRGRLFDDQEDLQQQRMDHREHMREQEKAIAATAWQTVQQRSQLAQQMATQLGQLAKQLPMQQAHDQALQQAMHQAMQQAMQEALQQAQQAMQEAMQEALQQALQAMQQAMQQAQEQAMQQAQEQALQQAQEQAQEQALQRADQQAASVAEAARLTQQLWKEAKLAAHLLSVPLWRGTLDATVKSVQKDAAAARVEQLEYEEDVTLDNIPALPADEQPVGRFLTALAQQAQPVGVEERPTLPGNAYKRIMMLLHPDKSCLQGLTAEEGKMWREMCLAVVKEVNNLRDQFPTECKAVNM